MSTRASIYCDDGAHLFEDMQETYEASGLHLDLSPLMPDGDTGQYGDFTLSVDPHGVHVSLRIPYEVCEALADWVVKQREWVAKNAPKEKP